jgi:GMP synthase-like glutamine amidotransferase
LCGICFGHQIIAQALGGKVEKIGWNLSYEEIQLNDYIKNKLNLSSEDLKLLCIHQDQVKQLTEILVIIE